MKDIVGLLTIRSLRCQPSWKSEINPADSVGLWPVNREVLVDLAGSRNGVAQLRVCPDLMKEKR
jgi:hypothetical protein